MLIHFYLFFRIAERRKDVKELTNPPPPESFPEKISLRTFRSETDCLHSPIGAYRCKATNQRCHAWAVNKHARKKWRNKKRRGGRILFGNILASAPSAGRIIRLLHVQVMFVSLCPESLEYAEIGEDLVAFDLQTRSKVKNFFKKASTLH